MNMTVEQFEQLLTALGSGGGSNAAILVFTGIAAFAGIIFVMWWVLNLKLAPLEKSIESLEKTTAALSKDVNELSKRIWAPGALEDKIRIVVNDAITEHEKNCSCRKCQNVIK